jgi:hypothetical protein
MEFALPINFAQISERRDFLGRVRLRPNRNRRAKFDVRGFSHEPRDTTIYAENTASASISAQTELHPTNKFCADFGKGRFFWEGEGSVRTGTGELNLMSAVSPMNPVIQRFMLKNTASASISAQTELRPTNKFCADFGKARFFFGRVRLRPNRNRRAKFDVRGLSHEPSGRSGSVNAPLKVNIIGTNYKY